MLRRFWINLLKTIVLLTTTYSKITMRPNNFLLAAVVLTMLTAVLVSSFPALHSTPSTPRLDIMPPIKSSLTSRHTGLRSMFMASKRAGGGGGRGGGGGAAGGSGSGSGDGDGEEDTSDESLASTGRFSYFVPLGLSAMTSIVFCLL